ncbi:MAG: hypothetical protein H6740_14570 [Alphaproteobacteria bacterium]|nr:hypothetical protein [Alphaproteobacteria bacterium]
MTRDLEWWQEFNRRFDPFRRLGPDEVDALYAKRPQAPSQRVFDDEFLFDPANVRVVLAGARGSGKTTEMLRLWKLLAAEGSPAAPVYVDVAASLPEDASTLTWLPLVVAAVRVAADDWGAPPAPGDPLGAALKAFSVSTDLTAKLLGAVSKVSMWLGPQGQAAGVMAETAATSLSALREFARGTQELRQAVGDENRLKAEALIGALRVELERLNEAASRPAALLLDGLDKRPDLESVFNALQDADLLLDLPGSIVLSGPIELRHDTRFAALVMPGRFRAVPVHNLLVVHRDGQPESTGVDTLVELYKLRALEDRAFGAIDVLPLKLVKEAAKWSSGVIREFLELVRRTGLAARRAGRDRAEASDLEFAVTERRQQYQATLTAEEWDTLGEVLASGERPRAKVDQLLFTNVVACYHNHDLWFRPNELLVDYIHHRRRDDEPSGASSGS